MKTVTLNGQHIATATILVQGIDFKDHPDYVDAYISGAQYVDGTDLTDEELDQLTEEHPELVNELANNCLLEQINYF